MNYHPSHSQQGFTLIELMIVMAIVGILAAIAYPAYTDSVRKSRRADAKAALLEDAGFLERYYSTNFRYTAAAGGSTGPTLPVLQVPRETGATATYNLSLQAVSDSSYTLQAVPTGAQTGDRCGTLTLTHLGVRGVSSASSGVTATDCW